MRESQPRVPMQRNRIHSDLIPQMSGDEAISVYREWRRRVLHAERTKSEATPTLTAGLQDISFTE